MQKALLFLLFTCGWTIALCQTVAVSAIKTNVFYQWLDNPLQVVIENHSCHDIVVKADKGTIKGNGCDYIYIASDEKIFDDTVRVGIKMQSKIKWLSATDYRVKGLPDPLVLIGVSRGGTMGKNELMAQMGLSVPAPDRFCGGTNDHIQKLISYSVRISRNDSLIFSIGKVEGRELTESFRNFIREKYREGDKVIFDNFVCVLYDKEIRHTTQTIDLTLREY